MPTSQTLLQLNWRTNLLEGEGMLGEGFFYQETISAEMAFLNIQDLFVQKDGFICHYRKALSTGVSSFHKISLTEPRGWWTTPEAKPTRLIDTGKTKLVLGIKANLYSRQYDVPEARLKSIPKSYELRTELPSKEYAHFFQQNKCAEYLPMCTAPPDQLDGAPPYLLAHWSEFQTRTIYHFELTGMAPVHVTEETISKLSAQFEAS